MVLQIGGAAHAHGATLHLDGHAGMALADQVALRPLHLDGATGLRALHALGNRNGRSAYPRHRTTPTCRCRIGSTLPDITNNLAPNPKPPRLAVRHHPTRSGQDDDPHPAPHPRDFDTAGVQSQPGPAHPREPRQDGLLAGTILQSDAQHPLRTAVDAMPVCNEPLVFQDARDLHLQPAGWDIDIVVPGADAVANPREHVRNWVSDDSHDCNLPLLTGTRDRGIAGTTAVPPTPVQFRVAQFPRSPVPGS